MRTVALIDAASCALLSTPAIFTFDGLSLYFHVFFPAPNDETNFYISRAVAMTCGIIWEPPSVPFSRRTKRPQFFCELFRRLRHLSLAPRWEFLLVLRICSARGSVSRLQCMRALSQRTRCTHYLSEPFRRLWRRSVSLCLARFRAFPQIFSRRWRKQAHSLT